MLAIDTETTGIDPWHGSLPFLVTTYDLESHEVAWWEWDVNPFTRQVEVPERDKQEIQDLIDSHAELVFQNAKFDIKMLALIGLHVSWEKVHDTLLLQHLQDSSQYKDLTSAALRLLSLDIGKYESHLRICVQAARRLARRDYPDWMIANADLSCMPSARQTIWKHDLWLPRQLAEELDYPQDYEWHTVTSKYANMDSQVTGEIFRVLYTDIEKRELLKIYEERRKILSIAHRMEERGIVVSDQRLGELEITYREESKQSALSCLRVAKEYAYELELPKAGNNKSLGEFIFKKLQLEPINRSKKTGAPSLDKKSVTTYLETLDQESKEWRFIDSLARKRKMDTALAYLEGYRRFMLREDKGWYRIHPSLNPVGTHTLRWSSQNPNEQNISSQNITDRKGLNLRYAFGPAPGREWWSLDYNNLELRIPAYECEEPAMLELFERPNDPPYFGSYHLLVFSLLYPDEFKQYGDRVKDIYKKTLYQWTKNGNFACVPVEGTEVLTGRGEWKSYNELGTGESVFGIDIDSGETVLTPVIGKWYYEDAPLVELRNQSWSAVSTPTHRWLVEQPDLKKIYVHTSDIQSETSLIANQTQRVSGLEKIDRGRGRVWCITTGCGNFYMRQGDTVTVTGNSLYGAIDTKDGKSTADQAFHFPGAQSLVDSRLKKKKALNDYWVGYAKKHGHVETMPDRTVDPKRGYPLVCPKNQWGSVSPTIPLNYRVQGTAVWVISRAMVKVQEYLDSLQDYYMVMQVHDELVFDFPYKPKRGNSPKIRKIVRLMESCGGDIGVPLTVGVDYHPNNWGESS